MKHFFPHLADMFNQMNDPRHPSYIVYSQAALIMMILMKWNSAIISMRGMTKQFNTEEAIDNLSYMCGQKLEEKPDWQTVNNYLERLIPDQLQRIIQKMVKALIRTKTIGAITHHIVLWMPIGLSAGVCSGLVSGHNSEDDNEDGADDKQ